MVRSVGVEPTIPKALAPQASVYPVPPRAHLEDSKGLEPYPLLGESTAFQAGPVTRSGILSKVLVRLTGVEPARLAARDSQSLMSTNFNTSAL